MNQARHGEGDRMKVGQIVETVDGKVEQIAAIRGDFCYFVHGGFRRSATLTVLAVKDLDPFDIDWENIPFEPENREEWW